MSFPLQRPKGPSPEAFWRRMEKELGTPIRAYALGQYLQGDDTPGPLWGLFYLTDQALYFRHFAQVNWWSAFTQSAEDDEESEDRDPRSRNVIIEVPVSAIVALLHPEERGVLSRIFQGPDRVYRLRIARVGAEAFDSLAGGAGEREIAFSIESGVEAFAAALERAIGGTGAGE